MIVYKEKLLIDGSKVITDLNKFKYIFNASEKNLPPS